MIPINPEAQSTPCPQEGNAGCRVIAIRGAITPTNMASMPPKACPTEVISRIQICRQHKGISFMFSKRDVSSIITIYHLPLLQSFFIQIQMGQQKKPSCHTERSGKRRYTQRRKKSIHCSLNKDGGNDSCQTPQKCTPIHLIEGSSPVNTGLNPKSPLAISSLLH